MSSGKRWASGLVVGALTASCSTAAPATATESPQPVAPSTTAAVGCSVVNAAPTPDAASLLPPVSGAEYARGPAQATVTLLYYCDFASLQCNKFNQVLDQLVKDHPRDLKIVMRPLAIPMALVPTPAPSEIQALDKSEI